MPRSSPSAGAAESPSELTSGGSRRPDGKGLDFSLALRTVRASPVAARARYGFGSAFR